MKLILSIFFLSACLLQGCGARNTGKFSSESIVTHRAQANHMNLERKRLEILENISLVKIAADKELKLKKMELEKDRKQVSGKDVSWDHCMDGKDEYPEGYTACLEFELMRAAGNETGRTSNASTIPTISGDNNVVMVGSPGAEISYGTDQGKKNPIEAAIIAGLNQPVVAPRMQQQPDQYGKIVDGVVSLGKAALYTVIGYKAAGELGGVLSAGMNRDSVGGDYVSRSYNPETVTTTATEIAK